MPLSSGGRGRLHTPALPDSPVRRGMEGGREGGREREKELLSKSTCTMYVLAKTSQQRKSKI